MALRQESTSITARLDSSRLQEAPVGKAFPRLCKVVLPVQRPFRQKLVEGRQLLTYRRSGISVAAGGPGVHDAGNDGAFGGGSNKGGGDGGSGGGEGGHSQNGGAGGWDPRRIWTLVYGLFILAGGVYARVKKGSRPSLIASSVISSLLLVAAWQMGSHPGAGLGIGIATTTILTGFMAKRYWRTRKFMPSGMLALTSGASAAWYAGWPRL